MTIVRVVSDLFFSSKITEACRARGLTSQSAKNLERLTQLLGETPAAIVVVDLGLAGGSGPELAGAAVRAIGPERVYAFYSHVDTDLLQQAEGAGVTQVFTRSAFFEEMPAILDQVIRTPS